MCFFFDGNNSICVEFKINLRLLKKPKNWRLVNSDQINSTVLNHHSLKIGLKSH